MIPRLRRAARSDEPGLDRLAELVRASQPLTPSLARQRRVRDALDAAPRRQRPRWTRLTWWAMAWSGLAFAGAMTGRYVQHQRAPIVVAAPLTVGAHRAVRAAPPLIVTPLHASGPTPASAAAPLPPDAPPSAPPANALVARNGRPARDRDCPARRDREPALPSPATTAPTPDASPVPIEPVPMTSMSAATLVSRALHALRHERDFATAGALTAQYLRRFPDGALAEQALAVAIEAAWRRQAPDAPSLARRYLARYPHGQFAALAHSVAP